MPKANLTHGFSEKKQERVGTRLAAGFVDRAIRNANANPGDGAAQDLANELSDLLAAHRRS
jgi:hypothetical protein